MTAIVVIMPVVKRVPLEELGTHMLQITVDRATLSQLKARAAQLNMTPEEGAAAILGEMLRPQGRRK